MKNYNYVAPYQERFLFSEQQKQRAEFARQQANQAILQQQAVKRQKQDAVDYSSIYGFDTSGWSTEYMDLFKQAQDHVAGKLRADQYQPGGLDSDVQSLINIHKTIKNMWDLSASSMAQYVNVMQDPVSHETSEMEIVETPEMLKNKLDYAVNWGMKNSYFNPEEMTVYGQFVGPDGSLLNEGNWMPLDQHPYITAEFWNPQMQLRAEEGPIDYAKKMQATLTGLLEDNVSVPEAKTRVIEAIKRDVRNTRNHIAYGQRNELVEVDGKKYEDWFAEDTWKLLSKALNLDTGSGSGSGSGDEEARLTPQDIRVYDDLERGGVRINGLNFPKEKEFSVNFGIWTQENPTVIREAFLNANLDPKARNVYLIPQSILYSEEKGTYTVISPATHTGESLSLDMTLDETKPAHQLIIDEIERKFRDVYGVNCSLKEIASRTCPDIEEGTATTPDTGWGSAERVE
jgi:multidrug efflux pump subunit AcrA (membrane-fusion protein)